MFRFYTPSLIPFETDGRVYEISRNSSKGSRIQLGHLKLICLILVVSPFSRNGIALISALRCGKNGARIILLFFFSMHEQNRTSVDTCAHISETRLKLIITEVFIVP